MNINLITASIVMQSVEDRTTVDRSILIEDGEFITLFKDLLNSGREDMRQMTDTLANYVNANY